MNSLWTLRNESIFSRIKVIYHKITSDQWDGTLYDFIKLDINQFLYILGSSTRLFISSSVSDTGFPKSVAF